MNDAKMIDLGMKRGEKDKAMGETSMPTSEKDWKNEMCYPCLRADGKQAEMLGADDLNKGEYIKQTVIWRVEDREKIDRNGKMDYRLGLEMVQASEFEVVDKPAGVKEEDDAGEADEGNDGEMSPGLAYIAGRGGE